MRTPSDVQAGWPDVSVIIPLRGDRGQVLHTLQALARQDYAGSIEIVLVDNGDNPGINELDGSGQVKIVEETQAGSYAARNRGVSCSSGSVLAFTDGDCLPAPGWLTAAVRRLREHGGACFVGGTIKVFPKDPDHPNAVEVWDAARGLRQDRYVEQGWAATANMVTARTTFEAVGAFDARFRSGGDREWGTRASAMGVTALFGPDALVDHPARAELRELHAKVRRVTGGEIALRRSEGRPILASEGLAGQLRPNTRSIIRGSQDVSQAWTPERWRYVALAHWLQYYFLVSRVRHAWSSRGRA